MVPLGDVDEAEAKDRARAAQLDIRVLRANLRGEDSLGGKSGHYLVRVDAGGEKGERTAVLTPAQYVYR